MNRRLISVVLLLAAAGVLAACGSTTTTTTGANPNVDRATAEEKVSGSFNAEKPTIIVETFNGNIDVTVGSGTTVKVDVTKRGSGGTPDEAKSDLKNIQVTMNQEGSTVRVTALRSDKRTEADTSGASTSLVVPPGSILQLHTSNGKVSTSGETAGVTVQSSNGAVDVRGAAGVLDLKTSNGNITVNGGGEAISLGTSNGTIEVTTSKETQITATSSNGALRFSGPLAAKSKNVLRTDNGAIVVTLPAASSFTLAAATNNGKVTSGFAIKGDNPRDTELKGPVGGDPQISLNLQTSNANIEIHKGN